MCLVAANVGCSLIFYWAPVVPRNPWIPLAEPTLRFCGTRVEKHWSNTTFINTAVFSLFSLSCNFLQFTVLCYNFFNLDWREDLGAGIKIHKQMLIYWLWYKIEWLLLYEVLTRVFEVTAESSYMICRYYIKFFEKNESKWLLQNLRTW